MEDFISARGICRAYREKASLPETAEITAKDVGQRAKAGDENALFVMAELGRMLGENSAYLLAHTRAECVVLGGQISKDFALFAPALRKALEGVEPLKEILPAAYPEDAALYGAAAMYFH